MNKRRGEEEEEEEAEEEESDDDDDALCVLMRDWYLALISASVMRSLRVMRGMSIGMLRPSFSFPSFWRKLAIR